MAKKSTKKAATSNTETIYPAEENSIIAIIQNKSLKAKEKTKQLSSLLTDKTASIDELVETAKTVTDASKATLIEAIEYTSKSNPGIVNAKAFEFVVQSLNDEAPRVKWEAAKVIANTARLFPARLKKATANLLINTEHSGNVVRWSAATALSEIILLNTALNKELIPIAEAIIQREEDNAVKKIYQRALKKAGK